MAKAKSNANTQARAGKGGVIPPVERQFGKENGNKQGRGFWKKEDTARYKLERMLELSNSELMDIINDPEAPAFEARLARCIIHGEWREIEGMINQVYGYPKQQVEQKNIEVKSILPKPNKEKK